MNLQQELEIRRIAAREKIKRERQAKLAKDDADEAQSQPVKEVGQTWPDSEPSSLKEPESGVATQTQKPKNLSTISEADDADIPIKRESVLFVSLQGPKFIGLKAAKKRKRNSAEGKDQLVLDIIFSVAKCCGSTKTLCSQQERTQSGQLNHCLLLHKSTHH